VDAVPEQSSSDGVSIDHFIATAVAEKAAALLTVSYLGERAAGLFGRSTSGAASKCQLSTFALQPRRRAREVPFALDARRGFGGLSGCAWVINGYRSGCVNESTARSISSSGQ
jgi:hypothetical protein